VDARRKRYLRRLMMPEEAEATPSDSEDDG